MGKTPLKQSTSSVLNRSSPHVNVTPTKQSNRSPFNRVFSTGLTVTGSSPSTPSSKSLVLGSSRFTPSKSRLRYTGENDLYDDDDDLENVDFDTMYLKRRSTQGESTPQKQTSTPRTPRVSETVMDMDCDDAEADPMTPSSSIGFQKRGKSLAKVVDKALKKMDELDSTKISPESAHVLQEEIGTRTPTKSSRAVSRVQTPKTPVTTIEPKMNASESETATPSVRRSSRIAKIKDCLPLPTRTPEVKRAQQRLKASKKLSTVVDHQDSSEYEEGSSSDYSESDDSAVDSGAESDGHESDASPSKRKSISRQPLLSRVTQDENDNVNEDEEEDKEVVETVSDPFQENQPHASYFRAGGLSKQATSDNTLSQLPELNQKEYIGALKTMPRKHESEIRNLHKRFMTHFPQWSFELESGLNTLFYGYGSKRVMLEEFARTRLTEAPVIIVNGFFPSVTVKDVTTRILTEVFERTSVVGTVSDHIDMIQEAFADFSCHWPYIYLLIHNIDGSNLRNDKSQTWLSRLAAIPQIRIIASVDHIHSPLLWDTLKLSRMNWSWHDLTTFEPYLAETSFENSLLVQQAESLGPRGILYVLRSLTENAKKVFMILAKHQLDDDEDQEQEDDQDMNNSDDSDLENVSPNKRSRSKPTKKAAAKRQKRTNTSIQHTGLTFQQYFRLAHESFLVGNEITFRTQLGEFRDHKIIHSRRGADGVEYLFIPLDKAVLQEILDSLNESR